MTPVLRQIRGFGPWGWALLPIAAWLGYCALGGFDLRHAIIEVCYHRFGEKFVGDVINFRLLFGSYWMSMVGVVCGPITLLPVLAAMHLSPRRWAWWLWVLVPAWLILNPWLCLEISRLLPPLFARWLGWMPDPGMRRVVTSSQVHGVVLVQLLLVALVFAAILRPLWRSEDRSRWRWAAWWWLGFGVTLGTFQWWADWPSTQASVPISWETWLTMAIVWHSSTATLFLGGAIAARMLVRSESWRCPACGYDRRGLTGDAAACPECGRRAATA